MAKVSRPRVDRATRKASAEEQRLTVARHSVSPVDEFALMTDGLSLAELEERRRLGLINRAPTASSRSLAAILRANLLTLFNAVVGGSFLLLLLLGQWRDALFGFAVVSNVVIGVVQEYRSKRTLDRLALVHAPRATVRRGGDNVLVPVSDVVLDDVLVLLTGDQVPADAVVMTQEGLELDESLLTGEADPVPKGAGDVLLSGSSIVAGTGRARVTHVGPETYASRISLEAKRFSLVNSELRNALARIVRWISWALIPLMIIATNGQMQAVGGWGQAWESGAWLDAAVKSIASIISMIPQGLVLITSIAFALAAVKLARRQVLVQELPAVEGLARVDVVCFDKTGTLTEGDIVFDEVATLPAAARRPDWPGAVGWFAADDNANATARALAAAFSAPLRAVVACATPFSSDRKWSSVEFRDGGTWVLGAPEMVLPASATQALSLASDIASRGLRTLVLAYSSSRVGGKAALPARLTPLVILSLRERVRSDARETIEYFRDQGLTLKVISGDNPRTVAAVARQAGITHDGDGYDARDLPEDTEKLATVLEQHHVFGRVTPEQKKAMVLALQSRGHVVAMTGDGVNDALALKRADLGIAMGSGSAATKAVSRIVLLDGAFASLPGVVAEGRRVIANVERVSRLFLTKTVWAMVLAITFGIALWAFPFLPRQLSAVDGYTIGIPAFFLALLPNARRYIPGFLRRALSYCIPTGLLVGGLVVALDVSLHALGASSVTQTQTAVSIVLSLTGLWVLAALSRPLTRWRLVIVMGCFMVAGVVFTLPLSTDFFGFEWPTGNAVWVTLGIGFAGMLGVEVIDRVVRRILGDEHRGSGPTESKFSAASAKH